MNSKAERLPLTVSFDWLRNAVNELETAQLVVMSLLLGAGIGLIVCRLIR